MNELIAQLVVVASGAICLAIPIAIVVAARNRSRRARIAYCRGWAARHRFTYLPEDPFVAGISTTAPFGTGDSRTGLDVFEGPYRGVRLHCFQYRYTTSVGRSQSVQDWQVVAVGLPASRPLLDIDHESALSKRFDKDIEFENRAFNDEFRIASSSPRFAYDVIHARTMEWMLADPRARTYRWRFEGPWLMTFRPGPLNLDEVFFYADFLIDVRAQVPEHVWKG